MSTPLVWSERIDNAPDGRLYDCTEASALMVLIAGGWTRFPLGIYTPEERNALDEASTRPENTGDMLADVDGAVAKRYGVRLHAAPVTTTAALAAELAKPGRAYILAGSLGHFEPGHHLRRWQPLFTGGHAACVVSGPMCRFLDPLAPNKYAGDPVTPAVAAQFAWQNWECRYLVEGELAPEVADTATAAPEDDMTTTITIHPLPAGSQMRFAAGTTTPLYDAGTVGKAVGRIVAPTDRATRADVDATVTIVRSPLAAPHGTFRRIALDSPYNAGRLIDADAPGTELDVPEAIDTAALQQALDAANLRTKRVKETVIAEVRNREATHDSSMKTLIDKIAGL